MADKQQASDAFAIDAGVPPIEGAIRPKPRFADRISKRVVGVLLVVLVAIVAIFFSALDQMDKKKQKPTEATNVPKAKDAMRPAGSVVPKDLTDAPSTDMAANTAKTSLVSANPTAPAADALGLDKGGRPSLSAPDTGVPSLSGAANPMRARASNSDMGNSGLSSGPGGMPMSGASPSPESALNHGSMGADNPIVVNAPPTAEEQAARAASADRTRRMTQARSTGLTSKAFDTGETKAGTPAVAATAAASLLASLQGQGGGGNMPSSAAPLGQAAQRTESEQDEKLSFLRTAGKGDQTYLQAATLPAVSKNELQRGSYIPLRLEGEINSDQPGMVKARVTEDVYDTRSGCRLLVPAMTLVEGMYDSKVAVGQTRNLVVWNYLGFEDGSHLNLGAMQGYDSSGAAGLAADVDNHYFKLFGLAFGMSLVTAGVQLSQPPVPTGTTAQTPEQAVATALAQQYGQLGAQILGKQMQVQPTLKNYPGERFMIMLPQSIVFKKVWRARC